MAASGPFTAVASPTTFRRPRRRRVPARLLHAPRPQSARAHPIAGRGRPGSSSNPLGVSRTDTNRRPARALPAPSANSPSFPGRFNALSLPAIRPSARRQLVGDRSPLRSAGSATGLVHRRGLGPSRFGGTAARSLWLRDSLTPPRRPQRASGHPDLVLLRCETDLLAGREAAEAIVAPSTAQFAPRPTRCDIEQNSNVLRESRVPH